jgi:FMN phosphatase YigB (HAD superfamily)
MIKTIFFDFDGVLTREFNTIESVGENLCKNTPGLSYENVTECYKSNFDYLLGEPSSYHDHWGMFCECIGQEIPQDIWEYALKTVTSNEEMLAIARSLKGRYKLGIITNNSSERMKLIVPMLQLSKIFDPIVVSADVRAKKNDGTTKIFDIALEATLSKPEESVFIDNQEKNLTTPKQMGMKTYWHDDKKNDIPSLVSALKDWGVK